MNIPATWRKVIYVAVIVLLVALFASGVVNPDQLNKWVQDAIIIAGIAAPILALFNIKPDELDPPKE